MTDTPSERVEQARGEMLSVMFDGNEPTVAYYGPDDLIYDKAHKRSVAENAAQLDAFIAAVRAEERARLRGMVEGIKFRDSVGMMNFLARATLELYREDVLALLTDDAP